MWFHESDRDENERMLAKLPRRYIHQQHQRMQSEPNYDHLLVFGYQCKLYRDNDKAKIVNTGQQLIPWMGDNRLMIDRYDVRGHLHDLSFFEPKNFKNQPLTAEELKFEEQLNQARYADLKYDYFDDEPDKMDNKLKEDARDEEDNNDEKRKSLQGACIAYDYDDNTQQSDDKCDETDDIFVLPQGIHFPEGLVLPESKKHAAVIEKTAEFVSKQNAQMEIFLKARQAANPSFDFLSVDSELYPFYKFVLHTIKEGKWLGINGKMNIEESKKINEDCQKNNEGKKTKDDDCLTKKSAHSEEPSSSELGTNSDSDFDHYLHPSLLTSMPKSNKNKAIPKIHDRKGADSKYSRVIKELRSRYSFTDDERSEDEEQNSDESKQKHLNESHSNSLFNIPEETRKIIEKLAESVAKNGDKFEASIRALNDEKFIFLNTNHEHHHYYIERKIHHFKLNKLEELKKNITTKDTTKIAFSLASKIEPKQLDHSASALLNEKQVREKSIQNLRKQKAAEFLKSIKNKTLQCKAGSSELLNNSTQELRIFGPELPQVNLDPVLSDDEMIEQWIENLNVPIDAQTSQKNVLDSFGEAPEIQTMFKRKNKIINRRERKRSRSRSLSSSKKRSQSRSPSKMNSKKLSYFARERSRSPSKNKEIISDIKKRYKRKHKEKDDKKSSKEYKRNNEEKEDKEKKISIDRKKEDNKIGDLSKSSKPRNKDEISTTSDVKMKKEENKDVKMIEKTKEEKERRDKKKEKELREDKKRKKREHCSRSRSKSPEMRSNKKSSSSSYHKASHHKSSSHRRKSSHRCDKRRHRSRSFSDSDLSYRSSRSRTLSPLRSHHSKRYR